jgi:hypothetical protein
VCVFVSIDVLEREARGRRKKGRKKKLTKDLRS